MSMNRGIVLTLMLLFVSSVLMAQTSNATLGGTVSDATGALIPGVEITARNLWPQNSVGFRTSSGLSKQAGKHLGESGDSDEFTDFSRHSLQ